jgi:hypothetical protein
MFSRSEGWWKYRRLADPERTRKGGVLNRVLLDLEGRPEAYALYRVNQSLEQGVTRGHVAVVEALGATPEATREIWHYLLGIDWIASVRKACANH